MRSRTAAAARCAFGRILAAYGGVFVAGSLVLGMLLDGFRPDRFDIIGAVICLVGVAVIMYAPRKRRLTTIRVWREASVGAHKAVVRRLVEEVMNARSTSTCSTSCTSPAMAGAARRWITPFREAFRT